MKKIFRKNKKANLLKHSYRPCDSTQNRSDSEHTQSLQTRNNGRFRMTENCHPKAFSGRHPEALAEGSIKDSSHSLRMTHNSSLSLGEGWGEGWHWQKALKTAALTLALSFFIAAPAMAADPETTPDYQPSYTLEQVEQTGTNVITKYEWSETDNKLVPQYYRVDLNKTEYGYPDVADDTKTFTVTTPNPDGSGNAFEYEIKYYVDQSRVKPDRITEDMDLMGADINNDFVGQNNTLYDSIIDNHGSIGNITGDFIGNSLKGGVGAGAAAISNLGTINNIIGDFIGNYRESGNAPYAGAISNYGIITSVTGNFIGNYSYGNRTGPWESYGGAIYNTGKIGDITGNFIGNYSLSLAGGESYAGAIYNRGYSSSDIAVINNITGDFIGNYVSKSSGSGYGGAINNNEYAQINNITSNFFGNYVDAAIDAQGGAIYNEGYNVIIGDITGNFIGNYATSTSSSSYGGAIYNDGSNAQIGDITGNFIGNYVSSAGTGIYSFANGGAIYNEGTIGDITGDFIGNYASSTNDDARGGAIYNSYGGTIGAKDEEGNVVGGLINSSFINNHATATGENATALGGAIYTNSSLNIIAKDGGQSIFSGNYTEAGGVKTPNAIYVENNINAGSLEREIVSIDEDKIIYSEKSSNFDSFDPSNNPALTLNASTNGVIRFDDQISGNADSVLVNNTYQMNIIGMAQNFEGKDEIYGLLGLSDDATVSEVVDAYFDYMVEQQFGDSGLPPEYADQVEQIKGGLLAGLIDMGAVETTDPELISSETKGSYDLKITGDSTGKVILNNDVINANISLDNTNLYLGREDVFNQSQSLTLNSGSIYLNNNTIGTMHVPTLNLNGNTNISVDADLANKSMDRITADNYNVKDGAMLNVNNVVLLSDAKEDVTNIQFADDALKGNVAFTGASPIAYSPIWKYDVSYNPDDGFFTFTRGAASSGNASDAFNPSVLASPVATQAGAYTTQLQTFNYAFQHADTFMNIPYIERLAIINEGKYALSPTGDATDVGTYSPLLLKEESAGFWVKPYASFENVPLKNGPKVSNINYGTLVGYDSPLTSVGNGFERVLTGYIGYNGASQRYQGVDAYQNGGLLGGTATFYKGNFFNATTLSVGASAGDASTMYGSENYTMLLAGLGNKTGYNFEFFDGGMILQPSMLISYTFVNTFDYHNAAGVRIESDPMHAIQLAPGIKLIGNTKNGWQPYIGVSMVWNLLDESRVTADSVRLPEMSIKPYVQYGVGLQKRVNDKFLAFGQAMIHNGGRNGVSLSAGLRWKIGRE